MKSRGILPEGLLIHLENDLSRFATLSDGDKFQIASLAWANLNSGRFKHKYQEGAFSIDCRQLEKRFRRGGFNQINQDNYFFNVSPWSIDRHATKAYTLSDPFRSSINHFLDQPNSSKRITKETGIIRSPAKNAIFAKDSNNQTKRSRANLPFSVPVNEIEMMFTLSEFESAKEQWQRSFLVPSGPLFERLADIPHHKIDDWLNERIFQLKKAICLANTEPGIGYVPHRYTEVSTGRLFGEGFSLQNAPREVRNAAFCGFYDYDFSNCHYSIFSQLTAIHGFECTYINLYLKNKAAFRERIAHDIGISINQAKECLIALIYGASLEASEKRAIGQIIGAEKVHLFATHDISKYFWPEIREGRRVILKNHSTSRNMLFNIMGKTIRNDKPDSKKLAHILQGCEAAMLNIALSKYEGDIVLPMHDGFVSKTKIGKGKLKSRIERETGIKIGIEEEEIGRRRGLIVQ